MNIFLIVLITLVIYSVISVVIYLILDEDDNVLICFGLGIVGMILVMIVNILYKIKHYFKYHFGKRSIFENIFTNERYKCKVKYSSDIEWIYDYKLIRRSAPKSEWKNIQDFSKEFLKKRKINCEHCKYFDECENDDNAIRCKHDRYGAITEFDQFVKG